jgi:site-specific recombinase XerD
MAEDFRLTLISENKSKATQKIYVAGVTGFARWVEEKGLPDGILQVDAGYVEGYIADLVETRSASTAKTRYGALQAFFGWLVRKEEIGESPMVKLHPPFVPEVPIAVLDDETLKRLLALTDTRAECTHRKGLGGRCGACTFNDRRDHAIVRLFIDSGMRRQEMAGIALADVDLEQNVVRVMGKGRRVRVVPYGNKTALAMRKYLRARAKHPKATGESALWLGKAGAFGQGGVAQMIEKRGNELGVHLHPHQFRHTAAHRWITAGGTEGDLMRLAGWRQRAMLDRYGRAVAEDRARDAHRRLGLGDQL